MTDAADGMPIIGATVVAVDPDGKTNAKSVGTITDIMVRLHFMCLMDVKN